MLNIGREPQLRKTYLYTYVINWQTRTVIYVGKSQLVSFQQDNHKNINTNTRQMMETSLLFQKKLITITRDNTDGHMIQTVKWPYSPVGLVWSVDSDE
jgi:hypothetical protein